jgi:glycosyltransferase involved in cell wall biosynthesis
MRIGIDARLTYYRTGGIAAYTRHLIGALAALDPASDYRVIHHRGAAETIAPGPNFHRVDAFTPSHHRFERWTLATELVRLRLDVLHSPDFIPPMGGARRRVITVHDLHFLHYPQFLTADSRRTYNDQIRWAVKTADHILVDSKATRADVADLLDVPPSKMTVHPLGVDPQYHPLDPAAVRAALDRLTLPSEYLLFVGTLEPRKNLGGLLDALDLLRPALPDLPPLLLVGRRGWQADDLLARLEQLTMAGRVIWRDDINDADLPAIYNGASLLALPSHYEGFGLTALEAMACGTPVVASNRSSVPEVVGGAGLLVAPGDPAAVADGLRRALEDSALRDRLHVEGPARASSFTWQRTAEIALGVYRAVGAS